MSNLTCGTCGSHRIAYNSNCDEWGWPYRCLDCEPLTPVEQTPPQRGRLWRLMDRILP